MYLVHDVAEFDECVWETCCKNMKLFVVHFVFSDVDVITVVRHKYLR